MDLQEKKQVNDWIEVAIKKVSDESDPEHQIGSLSADEINKLKPKEFAKYFLSFHTQVRMLWR